MILLHQSVPLQIHALDGRRIMDNPALLQQGQTDIAFCKANLDASAVDEAARGIAIGMSRRGRIQPDFAAGLGLTSKPGGKYRC